MFKTYQEYRNAWSNAYQKDPEVPLNLDLELAALCNLACGSCSWGESDFAKGMLSPAPDGKSKKRLMPTDMAMRLIDEAAGMGVPAIKLNYKGESTLHRDFTTIAKHAASKGFHEVLLNTNGNCPPSAIEGMMACTKVMVSLDSTDPAIYPKVRIGGNYETAVGTIRELIKRGHPNLWVRRVVGALNKGEDFVSRAKEMFGADTKISEHFAFDRNKDFKASIHGDNPEDWERAYCGYVSQRLIITAYGLILPCCIMWGDEYVIGEYPTMSLVDAWASDRRKNLAKTLRANDLQNAPDICKKCTSFMAYKRPERAYVQDVEGRAKM